MPVHSLEEEEASSKLLHLQNGKLSSVIIDLHRSQPGETSVFFLPEPHTDKPGTKLPRAEIQPLLFPAIDKGCSLLTCSKMVEVHGCWLHECFKPWEVSLLEIRYQNSSEDVLQVPAVWAPASISAGDKRTVGTTTHGQRLDRAVA